MINFHLTSDSIKIFGFISSETTARYVKRHKFIYGCAVNGTYVRSKSEYAYKIIYSLKFWRYLIYKWANKLLTK